MNQETTNKIIDTLQLAIAILRAEGETPVAADNHISPESAEIYAKLKKHVSKQTKEPFTWSDMGMYGPSTTELKAHWPIYPDPDNPEEMDNFWHGSEDRNGRSLNHSMNRMNKDWEVKSVRTPIGWRALQEMAVAYKFDVEMLVWAMFDHPRFGKEGSLFQKAATDWLAQHPK